MRKGWIAIALTVALLVLGYFFPQWMLSARQESKYHVWAKSQLAKPSEHEQELDMIQRLSLLVDPSVRLVGLEVSDQQATEAYALLKKEIEELLNSGYQPVPIDLAEFGREYYVSQLVYVDQARVLRAYEIVSPSAFAMLDCETHKILRIGSSVAYMERAADALRIEDGQKLLAEKSLIALAQYYDLALSDLTIGGIDSLGQENASIISGVLTDAEGDSTDFGIYLDSFGEFCLIGAKSAYEIEY